MKKFFSIILINLLLLVVLFGALSFMLHKGIIKKFQFDLPDKKISSEIYEDEYEFYPSDFTYLNKTNSLYSKYCGENRVNINSSYDRNPVVFLGCSYLYGHGLSIEETFPYLLSQLTQRKVYNFAECGGNLAGSLEYIEGSPEIQNNVKNADYVIYLYMHDHVNRYLYNPDLYYDALFSPNKFEKFIVKSDLMKAIISKFRLMKVNAEFPKTTAAISILKVFFHNSINKIRYYMPNAKIIFIIYDEKIPLMDLNDNFQRNSIRYQNDILHSSLWSELAEEDGIEVVYSKDILGKLADKDYKLSADFTDWHPNPKVWADFVPEFVKRYIE